MAKKSEILAKINILKIIQDHLDTLKDYGDENYSVEDIILFFIFPFLASFILVTFVQLRLSDSLIGILVNVFSIFAGLLFNLLVLVYDIISKLARPNDSSKKSDKFRINILKQIYSNISFEILLSLFNVLLLSVSSLFVKTHLRNAIFSAAVFYLVILFTLTFLMVLKRVHKLLSDGIENILGNM
jgi:FtsH-binding integral membrane protein